MRANQQIEWKSTVTRPRWIRVQERGRELYVACSPCNLVNAERVQRLHVTLTRIITPEIRTVQLDLRRIDHADTKLVAGLVVAARLARTCGVELVVHCSRHLHDLIHLCHLEGVICMAATE